MTDIPPEPLPEPYIEPVVEIKPAKPFMSSADIVSIIAIVSICFVAMCCIASCALIGFAFLQNPPW